VLRTCGLEATSTGSFDDKGGMNEASQEKSEALLRENGVKGK